MLRVHRSSPVGMTSSIWDHSTALVAEYREDASSPVSDLFQSPIAIAYLGVLAVLFGFLAYLALASQRAKTRRLESYDEMERVSESLMREGKVEEAEALAQEVERLRAPAPPVPKPWEEGGMLNNLPVDPRLAPLVGRRTPVAEDPNNRFMRRQKRTKRKKRKAK